MAEANAFVWSLQSSVNNISLSTRGSIPVPQEMNQVIEQVRGIIPEQASIEINDNTEGIDTIVEVENQPQGPDPQASSAPNNGGGGTNDSETETSRLLRRALEGKVLLHLAFALLLLARMIYEHIFGLAVFLALYGTFIQANSVVRKITAKREAITCNMTMIKRLWILIFPIMNIMLIYYIFQDQKLSMALYFRLPAIASIEMDIFTLLWIVVINDLVIKYATVEIKAGLLFVPSKILSRRRCGTVLMCVEEASQIYRTLLPIVPWVSYVTHTQHVGTVFSVFLVSIYSLLKLWNMWFVTRRAHQTFKDTFRDSTFGATPTSDDIFSAGGSCAICHDAFHQPVKLSCRHIFCEECVLIWFDREQTCPMCRKKVVSKPYFRDGSTDANIQWF